MSEYIILRDTRLHGTLPNAFTAWWNNLNIITTSGSTPLRSAFRSINDLHREHGRMHTLFILCHGFAGQSERLGICGDVGGQGLQLGRETVTHNNVGLWEQIQGTVDNIVIYACAASNTEAGNEFTREDGRYLMGALAIHTNATVYAANRIQWYNPSNFDFGRWEGQLFRFNSSGYDPRQVSHPPMELRDVASVFA